MRLKIIKPFGILTSAILLAACSTQQASYTGLSAPENGRSLTATTRFLSACPSQSRNEVMAIAKPQAGGGERSAAAVVAEIAGNFVANLISSELAAAKKGRDGTFTALGVFGNWEPLLVNNTAQYSADGCLVIYRGVSGHIATPESVSREGLSLPMLSALGLADQPAFYLELTLDQLEKSRQLSVNYLQYAATSARFNGTGQKNVTVAIGFATAAKKPEDSQSAAEIYRLNLGQLEIGRTYGRELAATAVSRVASATPPFNIVVEVYETDQPDVALAALASAFEANKSDVASAVTDAISGQ